MAHGTPVLLLTRRRAHGLVSHSLQGRPAYEMIFGIGFLVFFVGTWLLRLFFDEIVGIEKDQFVHKNSKKNWSGKRWVQVLLLVVLQFILSLILTGLQYSLYPGRNDPCCAQFTDTVQVIYYYSSVIIVFFVVNSTWLLYLLFRGLKYSKML